MNYRTIVLFLLTILVISACASNDTNDRAWLDSYPEKILIVSEKDPKNGVYYAGRETITAIKKDGAIFSVDHDKLPEYIWYYDRKGRSDALTKVSCRKKQAQLSGGLRRLVLTKLNKLAYKEIKNKAIKAVESEPVFTLVCEAEEDLISESFSFTTLPGNHGICPAVITNGVPVPAVHYASFNKNTLVVISIRIPGAC